MDLVLNAQSSVLALVKGGTHAGNCSLVFPTY